MSDVCVLISFILKMIILSKANCRFNAIPIKMPLFINIEEAIQKVTWQHKRPTIVKANLDQNDTIELLPHPLSNYTTELQSQEQHGISTRTDAPMNGTKLKMQV